MANGTVKQAPGWIDISVPIVAGMVQWPEDPPILLERTGSISGGGVCNLSRLDFGVHSGTHIDAPVHFLDGARGIEAVPLDPLVGPALVVDLSGVDGHLDADAVARLAIPSGTQRLLLRWNSALYEEAEFQPAFRALTGDGAAALVALGVRLVGNDYLSIAPFDDPIPTHRTLLEAGVVVVEGLDLRAVEPGLYDFVCLPLLIPGSDGGPARALVRQPNVKQ